MEKWTIDDLINNNEERPEESARYLGLSYSGGVLEDQVPYEADSLPVDELVPGDLVATQVPCSTRWKWHMITNDNGGGYQLATAGYSRWPEEDIVPCMLAEFDDVDDLPDPIVCTVHTYGSTLERDDLLYILQNGRAVFNPEHTPSTDDEYACRYISDVYVDTSCFEK